MRPYQIPFVCLGCFLFLAVQTFAAGNRTVENDDFNDDYYDGDDYGDDDESDEDSADIEYGSPVIETGFAFVDGEYLAPPYVVTASEDGTAVLINGREIPGAIPTRRLGTKPGNGFDGRFRNEEAHGNRHGWHGGGREEPYRVAVQRIRDQLEFETSIVAFTGQRLCMLNEMKTYALLHSLLDPDPASEPYQELIGVPHSPEAVALWKQWLANSKPGADFRRRAEVIITSFDEAEAQNLAAAAAIHRYDTVAYPLTILGMIMSVIAFGHLLMSLPNNPAMRQGAESGVSREIVRATLISVVLVAALSSLDLIWTILASQAGQMRELNPIASRFIHDPLALIAFKAAATILGCGLLYVLRQHGRAQMASWWLCLICTMLTFRWLMFNSMFIA